MKKSILLLVFTAISFFGISQDLTEISRKLLGNKSYQIESVFKELNVFYYQHLLDKEEVKTIILTVEDGNGVSYLMKVVVNDKMTIKKINVNFRHNNSTQIKALKQLSGYDDFHVGTNSTDIIYH